VERKEQTKLPAPKKLVCPACHNSVCTQSDLRKATYLFFEDGSGGKHALVLDIEAGWLTVKYIFEQLAAEVVFNVLGILPKLKLSPWNKTGPCVREFCNQKAVCRTLERQKADPAVSLICGQDIYNEVLEAAVKFNDR
jgi:hypothetical protein